MKNGLWEMILMWSDLLMKGLLLLGLQEVLDCLTFFQEGNLRDIVLTNAQYMWSNFREDKVKSRLYRFLFTWIGKRSFRV